MRTVHESQLLDAAAEMMEDRDDEVAGLYDTPDDEWECDPVERDEPKLRGRPRRKFDVGF